MKRLATICVLTAFCIGQASVRADNDKDKDSKGVPPGLAKKGGVPPGQAKKYGCRTYVYQDRPHYYYQDDNGRIIIRRPTIEIHGSVDIVK